jgi:transposase
LETHPITARSFEDDYHIDGDEYGRAYKDHLSGYREWSELGHADEWLIFPENISPHVSIDETCLSTGEVYTIASNKDAHGRKGCLIAVVKGTKAKDVIKALMKIPEALRMSVEEVTLDFSESMHNIVEKCFPKAMRTLDRFHHQQFCLEALQEVRREYRREQMTLDAHAREEHRLMMRQLQENDGPFVDEEGNAIRRNARYYPERLENGETRAELLARSKGLLMMSPEKWTDTQKERAEILFREFPDIKTAFSLTHSLRMIFSQRCTKEQGAVSLHSWYSKVGEFGNKAFNDIAAAMYDREDEILNYFVNRSTNASAESLNAKIKHFRAQLRGIIDRKFFLFRLMKIYA